MYINYSELFMNTATFRKDPDQTFSLLSRSLTNRLFGTSCKVVFPVLQVLVVGSYTITFSLQNK